MIRFHEEKGADLTIAVIKVKPEEAHRFGILSVDEEGRVLTFEEKPKETKSTLASMGIYVFNPSVLSQRLEEDARRKTSHDFGKDIIPRMLELKDRVYAYPFSGYWVDIGTIQAYWEAHMDILSDNPPFNLYDPGWVFHTRSEERPPVRVNTGATISKSLVSNGCLIEGTVERSVLSPGVWVKRKASVRYSIIMNDTIIGEGAVVNHAILDKNVVIGERCHIGFGEDLTPNEEQPDLKMGLTIVGKNTNIPAGIKIGRNCVIACDLEEGDFESDFIPSGKTLGHGEK
jgi:glucose-1-phosphate adenylyltransferase